MSGTQARKRRVTPESPSSTTRTTGGEGALPGGRRPGMPPASSRISRRAVSGSLS